MWRAVSGRIHSAWDLSIGRGAPPIVGRSPFSFVADAAARRHAARVAPLVAPDRILLARELRGLTQQALVERAGDSFTTAALSQIEQGHSRPSAATLAAIAEAVDCPIDFFVARPNDRAPAGFFRSLRSTTARDRRQYLAQARLLHDLVAAVEDHVRLPDLDVPRLDVDLDDIAEIEAAAETVRGRWALGNGPLPHVIRELERHGVVVVRSSTFKHEVDAFSVTFPGRPVVVLGLDKAVTARSRFDGAHELGHLVLHSDEHAGTKESEKQSHQFAAAFLMPRSGIADQLPETADWRRLVALKVEWRVSIAALLMRARTLGIMTNQRYVHAVKAMSARGWHRAEPGDDRLGALELPVLLGRAVRRLDDAGVTLAELCVEAALPIDEVRKLLAVTSDPRPSVEL
jgi:Zn-dependent peptidase ImmA (M78 family)/DNA-binding XRE family transcriptional regulator